MASREEQIRNQRLRTLKNIREKGIDPYPSKGKRTHFCNEVKKGYSRLKGKKVSVVGRIITERTMGKISFFTIKDTSGDLQIVFRQDNIGKEEYKGLKIFDTGDFVEVSGKVMKTKVGEVSVDAKTFTLLSKALMPPPDKFHGLKDEETRYRKRHLDFLTNDQTREKMASRAKVISGIRNFLETNGFLELQFPVLELEATGAAARPFLTHYNAYSTDVYLRICIELWQKRAIIGGFEKTFEIGRVFRNEGVDSQHNPEFTMCEFYWAYADYEDMMKFTEKLLAHVVKETTGKYEVVYQNKKVNFKPPYPRYSFKELLKKRAKLDIDKYPTKGSLIKELKKRKFRYNPKASRGTIIDEYYKDQIRPRIKDPIFLVDHPTEISPLAKKSRKNENIVERAQVVVLGAEIVNEYSELNDPIDQRERFVEQTKALRAGDEEAQRIDDDYIEAMEYGMPPIAGNGIGIDRLVMFLTDSTSMREVTAFPFMKPEKPLDSVGFGKTKDTNIAVAVINKGMKLKKWQEMNAVAHLNASHAARGGKGLIQQDTIDTKDGDKVKLNVQHAIMIKEAKNNKELLDLIDKAKARDLEVVEFIRKMVETSDDKKLIDAAKKQNKKDIDFLGVLVYGKKSKVEKITDKFKLYK